MWKSYGAIPVREVYGKILKNQMPKGIYGKVDLAPAVYRRAQGKISSDGGEGLWKWGKQLINKSFHHSNSKEKGKKVLFDRKYVYM
jgi:hypothetical protein